MCETTIKVLPELFAPAESSSFSGVYAPEQIQAGPDTYTFASPLTWNVLLTNTGGALLLSGSISGVGTTACSRCLEEMDVNIAGEIEGYFLLNEEEVELEEGEEEEFDILGPDNTIDLVPYLEAALLVDVPLQPLCREDCAGLCPDCGVNLNMHTCDCLEQREERNRAFEASKNPFAKLQELDFNLDQN